MAVSAARAMLCQKNAETDFVETLGQNKDQLIEIALARPGTSRFNRALYLEDMTKDDLARVCQREANVSFAIGLSKEMLQPIPLNTETSRKGIDKAVKAKNIISFDLDFKDNPSLSQDQNQEILDRLFEHKISPWLFVFSGHGLHLHFKMKTYELSSIQRYKEIYSLCQSYLESILGFKLDPACSNPSRLMRIPFSTNWKDRQNPIPCKLLFHNPNSDFSQTWYGFNNLLEQSIRVPYSQTKDKQRILGELDLTKILNHFNYAKSNSITQKSGQIICSSPFSSDSNPSFFYETSRKVFYDFSQGKGGDLFHLIAIFSDLDIKNDFNKVLRIAAKITGVEESTQVESSFKVDAKGVWFQSTKEASPIWLSSPVFVDALTRDPSNRAWGRQLTFRDQDGVAKSWSMPMELLAGDGSEVRKNLLNLGVEMALNKKERQLFLTYLQSSKPERRVQCVERIGWHKEEFVFPDKVISKKESEIVLQASSVVKPFGSSGSLEDWQENIGKLCTSNSRLVFSVSLAFASVLLRSLGEESGGFHFVGPSSIGKSITLKVAGSVWGNPGLNGVVKRWRSTLNGLELLAASRCDSLLILDELGEIQSKEAGNAAYLLAGGVSKNRATRNTSLAETSEWRLLFLSSGEVSLSSHISESGNQVLAGQEVRMLDLHAEANKNFGIFESLHQFENSASFAHTLSQNTEQFYGTPILDFLQKLLQSGSFREGLANNIKTFLSKISSQSHGQIHRAAKRFAIVAAAGELAIELGTLTWSKGESLKAAQTLFEDWKKHWSSTGSRESQQLILQIRALLQEYTPSRFPLLSEYKKNPEHHQQLWGFRKENETGFDWIVLSEVFRNALCKGFEYRKALKDLKELEFITVGSSPMRVPHLGVTRVLTLSGRIVSEV